MSEFLQQSPRRAGNLCAGLLMTSTLLFCISCHADITEAVATEEAADKVACQTAATAAEQPWLAAGRLAVQQGDRNAAAHAGCMGGRASALACLQAIHAPAEMIRRESLIPCP